MGQGFRRYRICMPHIIPGPQEPAPFKGVNVNIHPVVGGWVVDITPNPFTVSEAFRPRWLATFQVPEVPEDQAFTLAQHLSLLAMVLEDIAAERREPTSLAR